MTKCALVCRCVFLGNRGHSMDSLMESWEIREGLVSWTLRHLFSLSCPPPSFLSLNYKCPPTLGSGEPWTEGGMRGFHLLFINTGSGNTPHCQPNPLSLHLVPWQRGAAMTRYRAPDVPWMRGVDDRVFNPLQLWMYTDEDRVGWGWVDWHILRTPLYCLLSVSFFLFLPFPHLSSCVCPSFFFCDLLFLDLICSFVHKWTHFLMFFLLKLLFFPLCFMLHIWSNFSFSTHITLTKYHYFPFFFLSLSASHSCFPSFATLTFSFPLPPPSLHVFPCTLVSFSGLLWSINLCLPLRTSGATTAATVVVHTVAVVILHSPVLHLSCTASPRGVIPTDLLWQLKRSALQDENPNLYLCKIPRYPFSEVWSGPERPEWWVMEAGQLRLKVGRYIYCHQRSVCVIGDSLSPFNGNKSGNTMWRSPWGKKLCWLWQWSISVLKLSRNKKRKQLGQDKHYSGGKIWTFALKYQFPHTQKVLFWGIWWQNLIVFHMQHLQVSSLHELSACFQAGVKQMKYQGL